MKELTIKFNSVSVNIKFEQDMESNLQWIQERMDNDPYVLVSRILKSPVEEVGVTLKND